MKNKMSDLNDHLFAQIERLSDEKLTAEDLDKEVKRGDAIVAAADQIVRIAVVQVQAAKTASDHGIDPTAWLPPAAPPSGSRELRVVPPIAQGRHVR